MLLNYCILSVFILINLSFSKKIERADIIVSKDGSADFTTIQQALNSIPADNNQLKIILIKNGIYNEEIRIDKNFIALVGENRDSTRIEFYKPFDIYEAQKFDSAYNDFGRGIINIYADDITLANLTVENTQTDVNIHAFVVYGQENTRTIIINCSMLSNGGDTVSLWNGENGMYYHNTCFFKGAVDLLCPRGWCYAENIRFYTTRTTTPLWHDGSKNINQKFVVKNARFDGAGKYRLGRNHHDGAFYLINHTYSEGLVDQPFFRPESSPAPYKWGRRVYFYNCSREGGNYDWHADNWHLTEDAPPPQDVTAVWTFGGQWDPEANMPPVLPFAFLPFPRDNQENSKRSLTLNWIPGRNAQSHIIHFGKENPPRQAGISIENGYKVDNLQPKTLYYWRIDEVNGEEIIEGNTWKFTTGND